MRGLKPRAIRALGRSETAQPLREARDLFAAGDYKPALAEPKRCETTSDADIEAALVEKAASGDLKAAETLLRWRAQAKPTETQSTGSLDLDEMSDEELRACELRAMHLVAVLEGVQEPTDAERVLLEAADFGPPVTRTREQ